MCSSITQHDIDGAINKIKYLFDKFENNNYIKSKLVNHINTHIEGMLDNLNATQQEREMKKSCLNEVKQAFINLFMSENMYYYIPSSESFVLYDLNNYHICNEDEIQYNILTSISKQKALIPFKQQLKNSIIKQIKSRVLYSSTPDTSTIQNVLDLIYPLCFPTKYDAKYFLTILGDNILKKNDSLIHFIKPSCKQFFNILNQSLFTYLASNTASSSFKSKYQDHTYSSCRIIRTSNTIKTIDNYQSIFKTNALNLICVACHYSDRYKSSDNFIRSICNDQSVVNHVLYISNNTPDTICDLFMSKYIELVNNSELDNTACIS